MLTKEQQKLVDAAPMPTVGNVLAPDFKITVESETGPEYAKRIKAEQDHDDQEWTSGEVDGKKHNRN